MHLPGGINGYIIFGTDHPDGLNVVGMIVRYQYMSDAVQPDIIVVKMFLQSANTYTDIYQQCVIGSLQVVTVSDASTAYRYKTKHF